MKARIIKQARQDGSLYWSLSVKSSDGSSHILKLDELDYRKMNWRDGGGYLLAALDPPVKEFLGKVKDHINSRNELLDAVHGPGWMRPDKGDNV